MTAVEAQQPVAAGSCDNAQSLSALHANIQEKKDNSYYYAHKKKETGEEPAPPPVHIVLHSSKTESLDLPPTPISHYQFLDDGDFVKVFVPLENIGQLPDEHIGSTFEKNSFELRIKGHQGKNLKLAVKKLYGDIDPERSQHRKLKDKVTVRLAKAKDDDDGKCSRWSALRGSGN